MIQIDDPSVSGRHAQLSLIDDRYQLKDLDSTNGTRVNSESITDVFLAGRRPDSFWQSGGAL
jgi:pSer/pThr/pTyr-binding forkhead associated (FHA) protein